MDRRKFVFKTANKLSDISNFASFCKYIFIYGCIDNSDNLCISRVNQDGSNPILVIDGNGDVVMKPLEAVE